MSAIKFGDNVAVIGGKRVPYSLLGALAAILGAVLIWMQFKNSGGIALGGQSPDLSSLTDSLGGGGGDMSNAYPDLSGLLPQTTVPGSSIYIPSYSSAFTPSGSAPTSGSGPVLPKIDLTSAFSPVSPAAAGSNAPGFRDVPQSVSQPPPQITDEQRNALANVPILGRILSPQPTVPVSLTNRRGGNQAVA